MLMVTKLRMKIAETPVRLIRAAALRDAAPFEEYAYFAIERWLVSQKHQPETKRVSAGIPIAEAVLLRLKAACSKAGLTMARAVEIAFETYVAEEKLGPRPPEGFEFDPSEPVEAAPAALAETAALGRACHCVQCGYDWTPKGKGEPVYCPKCRSKDWDKTEPEPARQCHCTQCGYDWTPRGREPAYCPKCSSKEWAKIVLCENSCDRPVAPLTTDAGQSNMCEQCYREMKESMGPEEQL